MSNITTADHRPITARARAEYILIPFLVIVGLLLALGVCISRCLRTDELRHRLIPLYSYRRSQQGSESEEDGDEDEEDGDKDDDDEDDEDLKEPLRSDDVAFSGRLSFRYSFDQ
ncbi:hypothetical protein SKAU_G00025190 [Synaphobranchus kaupii]|uniref:Uncharacterized protein n=1 Tax=Synaphobranchus kaupii TaxID=118154 RepID=A0A9Q1GDV6_SYNKA|nr:hypothetical protein SKAU_G00025190 [Synaphobranchus kaupii]